MNTPLSLGWKSPHSSEELEIRTVYDLLDVVGRKPGVFLGEPDVRLLASFVNGFLLALERSGRPLEREKPAFSGFNDWLARRLELTSSTRGWAKMLSEAETSSSEAAFHRFFAELTIYRGNRSEMAP